MNIFPSHPMYEKINTLQLILCMAVNRAPFSEFEHMPEAERLEFIKHIKSEQQVEFNSFNNQSGMFFNQYNRTIFYLVVCYIILSIRRLEMKDHNGCTRAFFWANKSWYTKYDNNKNIAVYFGMYDIENGGTSGEMSMKWIDLGKHGIALTPQLQSFSDSWSALSLFGDLISSLGEVDSQDITQEEFVEMLLNHGFVDVTPYESPYE